MVHHKKLLITNENKIFEKDLSINNKITNDNPPNLRLLCDCLIGIIPISKQTGKWITNQNNELKQIANNNNLSMECSRYLQLLTPCLRLINSMFSSCPKNVRLHYQTLTYVIAVMFFFL